jgi:hypothetical protein
MFAYAILAILVLMGTTFGTRYLNFSSDHTIGAMVLSAGLAVGLLIMGGVAHVDEIAHDRVIAAAQCATGPVPTPAPPASK